MLATEAELDNALCVLNFAAKRYYYDLFYFIVDNCDNVSSFIDFLYSIRLKSRVKLAVIKQLLRLLTS